MTIAADPSPVGAEPQDPFNCPGCHEGDFPEFDHFCEALNVQPHELGHAFAAWLANKTSWDGAYGPVEAARD